MAREPSYTSPDAGRDEWASTAVTVLFCIVALAGAGLQAWRHRHVMFPDGICYLDMGGAWTAGEWKTAVNAYWPPLYAWLLGGAAALVRPDRSGLFPLVHAVNVVIFCAAMLCFQFFMNALLDGRKKGSSPTTMMIPSWVVLATGYGLFLCASLYFISTAFPTPDLLLSALLYLLFGILVRIRGGSINPWLFAAYGAILGLAALAKSVMFPLSLPFLLGAFLACRWRRNRIRRMVLTTVVFLAVIAPYLILISRAVERPTFGTMGRIAYYIRVHDMPRFHFRGDTRTVGVPLHPTQRLCSDPGVYGFAGPVGGTYPLLYDHAYWYEGMRIPFDAFRQVRVLAGNLLSIAVMFGAGQGILVILLALFVSGMTPPKARREFFASSLCVMVPIISAVALYALILVRMRYVAALYAVMWAFLFAHVRMAADEPRRFLFRRLCVVLAAGVAVLTMGLVFRSMDAGRYAAYYWNGGNVHGRIASRLARAGIGPGDRVARVGTGIHDYWVRLLGAKIIAEVAPRNPGGYFCAPRSEQVRVLRILRSYGATLLFAETAPACAGCSLPRGWQRIPGTPGAWFPLGSHGRNVRN